MNDKYVNISEKYGDRVEVTIADYKELNPDGQFEIICDEIRERFSNKPGDYDVVACKKE